MKTFASLTFGAIALLHCGALAAPFPGGIGFEISKVSSYQQTASYNQSAVYSAVVDGYPDTPVDIAVLQGSRYEIGYALGYMSWHKALGNYESLMAKILGTSVKADFERIALDAFLDFQWRNHLGVQVPSKYLDEMRGLTDGGRAAGAPSDVGKVDQRIIVLSNFPSDTSELLIVLKNEFFGSLEARALPPQVLAVAEKAISRIPALGCSMFAAWGERVEGGGLLSARNLDWLNDSGINKGKSITVIRPNDGANPHALFGYTGLLGALAGMNEYLSVHEANLEETKDTFDGFPFVLRLRYVMENSANVADASKAMRETNSTVGFNHMAASAADVHNPNVASPALVWETMAHYEANFGQMDSRENGATWMNPHTNQTVQIGYTLPNALYRTNHGYDPTIRSDYVWDLGSGAGKSSLHRYMQIYEGIKALSDGSVTMDYSRAINITAVAGSKGGDNLSCIPANFHKASNVLSVTFRPEDMMAWAAWEVGTGASWVPAACSTYIEFDLSSFLTAGKPPASTNSRVASGDVAYVRSKRR